MQNYYNDLITEKSWKTLQELHIETVLSEVKTVVGFVGSY